MSTATALGKRTVVDADTNEEKRRKLEEKMSRFTRVLTGEAAGVKGPLRVRRLPCRGSPGRLNTPFPHQRDCCKRMTKDGQEKTLILHDPGLGKTFTFLLFVAAKQTLHKGKVQKTIVSAPTSCLDQWYTEVLNTIRIQPARILKTNKLADITASSLASHDFFIVSRELVGRAFASCFEWVVHLRQNDRGNWCSGYDRTPGTEMHPLLATAFSIVGIDELHFLRNVNTKWTQAHQRVAQNAESVAGMTATPVFNRPSDMIGLATAMNMPLEWRSADTWFRDRQRTCVNLDKTAEFNRLFTDRATDDILSLPPITDEVVNFDVAVHPADVPAYNETLTRARKLHVSMLRRGNANLTQQTQLMAYLQRLQQMLVSPVIAEKGAREVKKDPQLLELAAQQGAGSLVALQQTLARLGDKGFSRIMVAACHTSLLRVAKYYLEAHCPELGCVLLYEGGLTQKKRGETVHAFLNQPRTVLLMSIDAGGTGLHLVPGSNAVVFWGSRPFSPMQVLQTKKRVHRIGQEHPVTVVHLIAHGSVDHAIEQVHADKLVLARAVVDEDFAELANEGGRWRKVGRIVDSCRFLADDGSILDDPKCEQLTDTLAPQLWSGALF